jgi:transmembrane sensor
MEATTVRSMDVNQILSWRVGELVFNDTRLADAVAEINRYAAHPIVIANSEIGDFRISGVFRSNDPERFSEAMSQILPVDLVQSIDGAPHLKARTRP